MGEYTLVVLCDSRPLGHAHLAAHVAQHDVRRDRVQVQVAAREQERKARPNRGGKGGPGQPGKCAQPEVEPETGVLATGELQHGQAGLVWRPAQTSPELLEEDSRAFGGPQEQHCVDAGNVEALVEQDHGKQCLDRPVAQCLQRLCPQV